MNQSRPVPNARLLAVIRESHLTYDTLARAVCQIAAENGDPHQRTNKSAIAHWVAGTQPNLRTVGYLIEALRRRVGRPLHPADLGLTNGDDEQIFDVDSLPEDPVAALALLGRADVDRRTVLTGAVYSLSALALPLRHRDDVIQRSSRARTRKSVTVGTGEISAVRAVTAAFTQADERLGGGHSRSAAIEYLCTDVAAYCTGTFSNRPTQQSMFGAAAQLAYLAGWKSHDLGLSALAQRYYLYAFQLANEADPYGHAGYVLRILAHQAMDLGRPEHCVDLAEAALARSRGRVDAGTESLFWLTLARAHAINHSARESLAALSHAEGLMNRDGVQAPPEWASLGGPAEARLANQSGKTLVALGELRTAEEQFQQSARCWNPVTHPRIHALTLTDLAETQCAQGKIDQACDTWAEALDEMNGVRSARIGDALSLMRRHLAIYRRRGNTVARRLDARAAALQRQSR
jgi:tetratricopeptide (TPR) repeat protein